MRVLHLCRDDIRRQLQRLRLTADDLQECLMVSCLTPACLPACLQCTACGVPPSMYHLQLYSLWWLRACLLCALLLPTQLRCVRAAVVAPCPARLIS